MPKNTTPEPMDDLLTRAAPAPLVDTPREGSNTPEWSVSDLSRQLKSMVEGNFGHVRVRGEIGECKLHSSGHLYLSLKDDGAVLAAVCWRGKVSQLGMKPATGMEVVCTGKLTTYAGQSKYQLTIEAMALAGQGALLKMLEDRRVKLAAEGLFDERRKKPLPFLPAVIGVVTSPTGAVIRDILHRLEDRFPRHVLVWPVPVQGEGAADKIAAAITGFNALEDGGATPRPDVLIVARGGGSLEDLMPFNEEIVVRAVAASRIPVISAVGHETDTTLVDYAADLRAPTPTAAAEKAVPVRGELLSITEKAGHRLNEAMRRSLRERGERVTLLARALGDPLRALAPLMQRLDERAERLIMGWHNHIHRGQSRLAQTGARLRHPRDTLRLAQQRLDALAQRLRGRGREQIMEGEKRLTRAAAMLTALSPRAVLSRGYSLAYDAAGRVVMSAASLKKGDSLRLDFHDGSRKARVEE